MHGCLCSLSLSFSFMLFTVMHTNTDCCIRHCAVLMVGLQPFLLGETITWMPWPSQNLSPFAYAFIPLLTMLNTPIMKNYISDWFYHSTTCYSPLAFSQKIWAWLQFGFLIWNLHDDYCVNFVVFMTAQIPNLVQITVFLHIVGPISTYPVTVIASRSPIMEVLVTPEQVVVLIQIPKAQSQMVHFLEKIQ